MYVCVYENSEYVNYITMDFKTDNHKQKRGKKTMFNLKPNLANPNMHAFILQVRDVSPAIKGSHNYIKDTG